MYLQRKQNKIAHVCIRPNLGRPSMIEFLFSKLMGAMPITMPHNPNALLLFPLPKLLEKRVLFHFINAPNLFTTQSLNKCPICVSIFNCLSSRNVKINKKYFIFIHTFESSLCKPNNLCADFLSLFSFYFSFKTVRSHRAKTILCYNLKLTKTVHDQMRRSWWTTRKNLWHNREIWLNHSKSVDNDSVNATQFFFFGSKK